MSLSYKHSPFGLQEFPMLLVSGFLHYNLSSVISFLRVPPRFLFYRNECRTTLVFPSCQIKKLLSEYIERKDTVSNVLNFIFLPFAAFIRWLSTYLAAWSKDCFFFLLTRSASHLKCSAACGSRKMEACASRLALSSFFLSASILRSFFCLSL